MPARGVHDLLAAAPPPPAPTGAAGAAPGHDPRRVLPLSAELRRQLPRRRTQLAFGFLVLLPFLLVLAFKLGDDSGPQGTGFVDLASLGAVNFTVFTLYAVTGFLLVVVVALFAGDTVASEASWASLRYLLAVPVARARLLRQKLVVALVSAFTAIVALTVTALLAGWAFFGWEPLRTPYGSVLGTGESLGRLAVVVGYLTVTALMVAALAFLLGVCTDAPLGAVGGAVLLVILSSILDAVNELGAWRQLLPTHYQFAWTDALQPAIVWDTMARGVLTSVAYSAVFLAAAWWHFLRKDVVS